MSVACSGLTHRSSPGLCGTSSFFRFTDISSQSISIPLVRRHKQLVDLRNPPLHLDAVLESVTERRFLCLVPATALREDRMLEVRIRDEVIEMSGQVAQEEVLPRFIWHLPEPDVPRPECSALVIESELSACAKQIIPCGHRKCGIQPEPFQKR